MMRKRKQKPDYTAPLQAEHTYHIYNRTNNKEALFRDDTERRYFLSKYEEYIMPYVDSLAYCLLGNHFHLLVRVKSVELIYVLVQGIRPQDRTEAQKALLASPEENRSVQEVLAAQFTRLFTSYAVHVNPKWDRKGNLFHRPFKRILVDSEVYFARLVYYIHKKPEKHRVYHDFTKYFWSSYQAYLSDKPTRLKREEVLGWFGGRKAFEDFHRQEHDLDDMNDLLLED
ncbi:MAG: hypothetical protein KF852_20000 [Saprospiraceae bacterium]|nr:hypothetical protein [Saprospiraceae bacterium]